MSKATMFAQGVRENEAVLKQQGIVIDTERIDALCKELEVVATRQEEVEQMLHEVRGKAHELLSELKDVYNEGKSPVKLNFPPEAWAKFGLPDKR